MYEYARRRHIMYQHTPPLIKSQPKDPIHQQLNDELEQEEHLRHSPQDAQVVDLREVTPVGADVVEQTAWGEGYLG